MAKVIVRMDGSILLNVPEEVAEDTYAYWDEIKEHAVANLITALQTDQAEGILEMWVDDILEDVING